MGFLKSHSAIPDQLNHHHGVPGHAILALFLEHVRDGASDVQALDADPVTATSCGCNLRIVDNVVGYDILFNRSCLLNDNLLCASARSDKNQASIGLFADIVDLRNASVRHDHRHFDVLDDAT